MTKLTYSDKVKAGKKLVDAIYGLRDNEHVVVTYGRDYNGDPKRYRIRCSIFKHSGASYSIYKDDVFTLEGMNISEFTNTMAKAYTYDLMGQKTTYNFPLHELILVEEPYKETTHSESFN